MDTHTHTLLRAIPPTPYFVLFCEECIEPKMGGGKENIGKKERGRGKSNFGASWVMVGPIKVSHPLQLPKTIFTLVYRDLDVEKFF